MAINDLSNQNIKDTYQRIVQTADNKLSDGTGSLLPIEFYENHVIISGNLDVQAFGGHITMSGVISSSGGQNPSGLNNYIGGHLNTTGFIRTAHNYGYYVYDAGGTGRPVLNIDNNDVVQVGDNSYPSTLYKTSVNGTNITLDGPVTASSTVSASGFITDGHVTSSGNISASGELIGKIDGGKF